MTTSSGRLLKSADLDLAALEVASIAHNNTPHATVASIEEQPLFTTDDVEELCAKAEQRGAERAGSQLTEAIERLGAALSSQVDMTNQRVETASRQDAERTLETSIAVARWVIGQELDNPETLQQMIVHALSDPARVAETTVRLNPTICSALATNGFDHLPMVEDPQLSPDAFIIDTGETTIAFDLDDALNTARTALNEAGS